MQRCNVHVLIDKNGSIMHKKSNNHYPYVAHLFTKYLISRFILFSYVIRKLLVFFRQRISSKSIDDVTDKLLVIRLQFLSTWLVLRNVFGNFCQFKKKTKFKRNSTNIFRGLKCYLKGDICSIYTLLVSLQYVSAISSFIFYESWNIL